MLYLLIIVHFCYIIMNTFVFCSPNPLIHLVVHSSQLKKIKKKSYLHASGFVVLSVCKQDS